MLVALAVGRRVPQAVQPRPGVARRPAAAAPPGASSWADPQIRSSPPSGSSAPTPPASDPPIRSPGASSPTRSPPGASRPPTPADPAKLVTMSELDAQLVGALGLLPPPDGSGSPPRRGARADVAARHRDGGAPARSAPQPPAGLGRSRAAPTQPATRAEAAYSFARALALTPGQITWLDQLSATFTLPELDEWQRAVLGRALRFVGYPYVWAGTSEATQKVWSATAPGGWVDRARRVRLLGLRLARLQDEAVPRRADARRHPQGPDDLRDERARCRSPTGSGSRISSPATCIFFGSRGTQSTPAEVGHTGIYVGNGWFVHSSGAGVTLQPLAGLVHEDVRLGEAAAARGRARRLRRSRRRSDRAGERVARGGRPVS